MQIECKHKAMPRGCGVLTTEQWLHNSAPPQPVNKKLKVRYVLLDFSCFLLTLQCFY